MNTLKLGVTKSFPENSKFRDDWLTTNFTEYLFFVVRFITSKLRIFHATLVM